MAAFKASKLVWSAIDWIIELALSIFSALSLLLNIISYIFVAASLFSFVFSISSFNIEKPSSFLSPISLAALFNSSTYSLFCSNKLPISSTLEAEFSVSCAWLPAPFAISSIVFATSSEAVADCCDVAVSSSDVATICCADSSVFVINSAMLSRIFLKALAILPISSSRLRYFIASSLPYIVKSKLDSSFILLVTAIIGLAIVPLIK